MSGDAAWQRRGERNESTLEAARQYTDQQLLAHGAAGRELAYAALGTSQGLDSTTTEDQEVPGLQITPTLGERPVLLSAGLPLAVQAGRRTRKALVVVRVGLWDLGWDELTMLSTQVVSVALTGDEPAFVPVHLRRRIGPSPGPRTFRLGCRIEGDRCAVTVLGADRGAEAFLECVER